MPDGKVSGRLMIMCLFMGGMIKTNGVLLRDEVGEMRNANGIGIL